MTSHANAVVDDPNQGSPALLNLYRDLAGTCVDCIVEQFLDHR
jgi:hypothetical protein